jgi:glucose/arabinose dehydrogenase
MRLMFTAAALAPLLLGAALAASAGPSPETRDPNNRYQPAFENQTRAPLMTTTTKIKVEEVATGLAKPWALTFLPGQRLLVTERTKGQLRIVAKDGTLSAPVAGVPAVDVRGQGGLLDVELDPDFASNHVIYLSYADKRADGTGTNLAKAVLVEGPSPHLDKVEVIFREMPSLESTLHYGGQIAFNTDKTLWLTLGERSILPGRAQAQDLKSDLGKVIRINRDGSIPKDNPFVGRADARPEIWSYGHRNVQGSAINPTTKKLWTLEHGPRGGDEVNVPAKGKDYGWPTITYGHEYPGPPVGAGIQQKAGMEQPIYYWDPIIGPGSMSFYTGNVFPAWKGSLLIGSMGDKKLVRLTLNGEKVVGEEWLLKDLGQRIRDVRVGADGAVYLTTDEDNGKILKLVAG